MRTELRLFSGGNARGAVLILVLVFILLLNLLAATVLESANLQSRMAGNNKFYGEALELAQGVAQEVSERAANFSAGLPPGAANCLVGDARRNCAAFDLQESAFASSVTGAQIRYQVLRLEPETTVLRGVSATGPVSAEVALYEVLVSVSLVPLPGGAGMGEAGVGLGMAVPVVSGDPLPVYWREPAADSL